MTDNTIKLLQQKVQVFYKARDWDQYHGLKELAIGNIAEAINENCCNLKFKIGSGFGSEKI